MKIKANKLLLIHKLIIIHFMMKIKTRTNFIYFFCYQVIYIVTIMNKLFFNKPTIGIGVRRGDFVNHSCFYQIPETWYEDTLKKEFPNFKDYNVIIFSDDIEWCKIYFKDKGF
jgi:hypothetical protein